MFKYVCAVAAMAAFAAPAQAASKLITFSLTGNSATTGTHGNVLGFSAKSAGDVYSAKVRVTGWSMYNGRTYDSYVGAYSNGLGITSDGENGGSPGHSIDNSGRKDFLILQFDQKVSLISGKFTTYAIGSVGDTDATIGWNNSSLAWTTKPTLNDKLVSSLNALIPTGNRVLSSGGSAGGIRMLGNGTNYSNVWLVGADFNGTEATKYDGFKFGTMTVAVIPEPATWAMMIGGFGFVGAAMRRQRKVAAFA